VIQQVWLEGKKTGALWAASDKKMTPQKKGGEEKNTYLILPFYKMFKAIYRGTRTLF